MQVDEVSVTMVGPFIICFNLCLFSSNSSLQLETTFFVHKIYVKGELWPKSTNFV